MLAQHRHNDVARLRLVLPKPLEMRFGDVRFLIYEDAVANILQADYSRSSVRVVRSLEV